MSEPPAEPLRCVHGRATFGPYCGPECVDMTQREPTRPTDEDIHRLARRYCEVSTPDNWAAFAAALIHRDRFERIGGAARVVSAVTAEHGSYQQVDGCNCVSCRMVRAAIKAAATAASPT